MKLKYAHMFSIEGAKQMQFDMENGLLSTLHSIYTRNGLQSLLVTNDKVRRIHVRSKIGGINEMSSGNGPLAEQHSTPRTAASHCYSPQGWNSKGIHKMTLKSIKRQDFIHFISLFWNDQSLLCFSCQKYSLPTNWLNSMPPDWRKSRKPWICCTFGQISKCLLHSARQASLTFNFHRYR